MLQKALESQKFSFQKCHYGQQNVLGLSGTVVKLSYVVFR